MIKFHINIQLSDTLIGTYFSVINTDAINDEAVIIEVEKGISLKLIHCKTTNDTTII